MKSTTNHQTLIISRNVKKFGIIRFCVENKRYVFPRQIVKTGLFTNLEEMISIFDEYSCD